MEKLTYYSLADNDMLYLKDSYDLGQRHSAMTSLAAIVERYLKHILQEFCDVSNDVLRTHNLKKLLKILREELPEFEIDKNIIMKADGYYYNTRYPGDDAFIADASDVVDSFEAAKYAKRVVDEFLASHQSKSSLQQMNLFCDLPELK